MLFNSLTFIGFFAIVLALHYVPGLKWRTRKLNLLVASYLFYAAWNPPFVILLWISTVVDWFVSRAMANSTSPRRKKAFLMVSLGTNLGLLGYFKYGEFFLNNFVSLMDSLGVAYQPPEMDIVLPVGISFYTFQTLSYTIDVYRGDGKPWHSFGDFALFVTFFPQLVAGPIVRAFDFLPQCTERQIATARQFGWGLVLLTVGLFEKTVVADALLAPVADRVYLAGNAPSFGDAWLGTFAFAGQIFCDFAGYSTCAIGAAMCLGFVLPDNFRYPYAAIGFSDFWRRWHISLSQWLRDYLYISLGGNRRGKVRTYVNLMLTMLIGGLWHGASWVFVVWGGLHGIYLVLERVVRKLNEGIDWPRWVPLGFIAGLVTYLLVCIAWVFFRAPDFPTAYNILSAMLWDGNDAATAVGLRSTLIVSVVTVAIGVVHAALRNTTLEDATARLPWWVVSAILCAMLLAILTFGGSDRAFIYFQF